MQETLKANPYEYADNNPVNNVDPHGKAGLPNGIKGCIGGALLGIIGWDQVSETTLRAFFG
ncbi:hypothetical protein KDK_33330 [Dictyobacter kobayashii]|uniref:Uncharacterized protein n=1 Tax=Dictyobacter kobayashii TaxID=2014872 RepID=A0A402AKC0_9CHLR|nr:hypothetical protein KDK_33330 [Dictyobacter kobayashii]